jgi:hypothetical protein
MSTVDSEDEDAWPPNEEAFRQRYAEHLKFVKRSLEREEYLADMIRSVVLDITYDTPGLKDLLKMIGTGLQTVAFTRPKYPDKSGVDERLFNWKRFERRSAHPYQAFATSSPL